MIVFLSIVLCFAAFPVVMIVGNWSEYRSLPPANSGSVEPVSILIPARNEERNIAAAIESVITNLAGESELIILDDHSTDRTAEIVNQYASADPRVRLATAPPLPDGWCGKQHACSILATLARHDLMMWIDADVTLENDAIHRISDAMQDRPIGLLSGFPRQSTQGWLDSLLIPLIHFVLLGYLPLRLMRKSNDPAISAGCGQLFIARRAAYVAADGHAAIRNSTHDGVQLPRSFRRTGQRTDLFDATDLASCRMYSTAGETWKGLLKNAHEGMATPTAIIPWTAMLLLGSIVPPIAFIDLLNRHASPVFIGIAGIATLLPITARLSMAARFKQSVVSAVLHPLVATFLLFIQWQSIVRQLLGMKSAWKGRTVARIE